MSAATSLRPTLPFHFIQSASISPVSPHTVEGEKVPGSIVDFLAGIEAISATHAHTNANLSGLYRGVHGLRPSLSRYRPSSARTQSYPRSNSKSWKRSFAARTSSSQARRAWANRSSSEQSSRSSGNARRTMRRRKVVESGIRTRGRCLGIWLLRLARAWLLCEWRNTVGGVPLTAAISAGRR